MDTAIQQLIDRQEIVDTVTAIFVATDQRDWHQVESCLAEEVTLDMTSFAGGAPVKLTASQVASGWQDGLRAIDEVHHQIGNFRVELLGKESNVFCYGIAYHQRRVTNPDNSRTFVGSYNLHLIRTDSGWRIDLFRFNLKFISGNLELETAT